MAFSFSRSQAPVLTVGEVNRTLRSVLEQDERLEDLWVAGEISNLSRPASGHVYFTMKDAQASLRCVLWRADAQRIIPRFSEGDAVEAHGYVSLYEAGGQVQLYVDDVRLAGEGERFREFLRLKAALEQEGLFDPAAKQPLPAWPGRIGLVTSASGAALQDVLTVLQRRYPLVEVVLAQTAVQGEMAAPGMCAALEALQQTARPDVILLVRGGGSIEDLWAFNEPELVRAVARCPIPIITGIGHETDFTLVDFAADVRAPTPSVAAELATPDQGELRASVRALRSRLSLSARRQLADLRRELVELTMALRAASPRAQLANARQWLDELARLTGLTVKHELALRRAAVEGMRQALEAVSPQAVLSRGYAIVTDPVNGSIVRSARQVRPGDRLDIRLGDGTIAAKVEEG